MMGEMAKGYVYRAATPLTAEALASLIGEHFKYAHAIVKRPDDARVVQMGGGVTLPGRWTEGQIFNKESELRWRRTAEGFAALWLMEREAKLAGFVACEESFIAAGPSTKANHGFLLWGTRLDPSKENWWETRIPRRLVYPGFPAGNETEPPHLTYLLYRSGETVRWVRLVGLVKGGQS